MSLILIVVFGGDRRCHRAPWRPMIASSPCRRRRTSSGATPRRELRWSAARSSRTLRTCSPLASGRSARRRTVTGRRPGPTSLPRSASTSDISSAHIRCTARRWLYGALAIAARRCATSDADIIVANDPAAVLAIQTADCVPLLIADRRTGAVAAAHAGWRGMAARVPVVAVHALASTFGSRPGDLVAAIGPSISGSCYEVGGEVRERFTTAGFPAPKLERWFSPAERPGHWLLRRLDLGARQLRRPAFQRT